MIGSSEYTARNINHLIWRVFNKSHGLTLQTEATSYIRDELNRVPFSGGNDEIITLLSRIAEEYKRCTEYSTLVSVEAMKFLFNQLRQNSSSLDPNGQELAKSHIRILNADQTDRWDYDDHKRFFIKTLKRGWSVNPDPLERSAMFRRRHQILRQRLARTGLGVHFMSHENTEITFNSLITVRQAKSLPLNMSCAIFGMLSIIREDELFIEDLDDFIKITVDRSICDDSGLFYSEGCFVIIYGLVVSSGVVQVLKITQPPMEPRQLTLQTASHPDLFDSLNTSRETALAAQDFQSRASLVILSDLNNPSCGLRLVKIFKTYEKTQKCPALFIFMGPFHEKLSEQIAVALEGSQRVISEARFVFVPAARDFMSPEVYPIILKSPLLGADDKSMSIRQRSDPLLRFLSPLRTLNVECEFASNPCRIFFFTKEIVVINDEVTKCFKSNDIFHRESQTSASAMETMLHQASIFPFSLQAKARRWDLEHATCLYPTPDYLILGEKSTSHQTIICGCLSVNPGSFSEDSSFAVLFPLIDRVDLW